MFSSENMKKKIIFAILLSIIYLLFLINIINITKPSFAIFNTPDESANYQVLKQYTSQGKLFLEDNNLVYDSDNNLHGRGFLTWRGKIVPFNFLGLPIFYGPIHLIIGDYGFIISSILFIILIVFLTKIIFLLFEEKYSTSLIVFLLIGIIAVSPLIYWFNFSYLNLPGAITFFISSLYFLLKFNKENSLSFLLLSILLALISIWFRYDYAIFFLLLFIINFIKNKKCYLDQRKKFIKILIILIIFILIFIVPLLILNKELYGSYFEYGYQASNKVFYPEERASSFSKILLNTFLPGGKVRLDLLITNIKTSLFLLAPLFFFFSFISLIKLKKRKIWAYLIIIFYILIYMGMSETFGSGDPAVTLNKSITRYWLPIYLTLILPFVAYMFYLSKKSKILIVFLIFYLVIPSTYFFLAIREYQESLNGAEQEINKIKNVGPPDYILSAREDKYLYTISKPITWWCVDPPRCDLLFNAPEIAQLITKLVYNNQSVYLRSSISLGSDKMQNLREHNLTFELLIETPPVYKISIKNETAP